MTIGIGIAIGIAIATLVVGGVVGFVAGGAHRKKVAEAAIGSATQEAARIVNNAMTEAEQRKKEFVLEAKDEIHKFGRTYHFNAIVLNKVGLKNLFQTK